MLERLTIEGLRGIASGELTALAPLTVLVGPNGSGKSTLLDALLIATHPFPAAAVARAVEGRRGMRDGARWLLRHADERAEARLVASWQGGATRSIVVQLATGVHQGHKSELDKLGGREPYASVRVEVTPPDHATIALHTTFDYDGRYVWEKFQTTAPAQFVRVVDGRQPFDPIAIARAIDTAGNVGAVKAASDLIRKLVPEYPDLRVGVDAANQPYPKLQGPSGAVPLQLAGDGVQSAVRLALAVAGVGDFLVLLEEPEVHLHRGALAAVGVVLVNAVAAGAHVVLSTHSLELIDALLDAIEAQAPEAQTRRLDIGELCVLRTRLVDGVLGVVRMEGTEVRRDRRVLDEDLR